MSDRQVDKPSETEQPASKPSLMNVVGSVLAAGIGVQSSKNKERDFQQGSFKTFVIAGIIFTVLFVATVATIVFAVLESIGK